MMKSCLLRIKLCIMISLMLPIVSLAEEAQTESTENTAAQEECNVNLLQPPKLTPTGEVLYLSGGTCSDSVRQIKALAKSFPLEVVLVEKTDEYDKESYIADVVVDIKNKENNVVLNVITEGPYLLVDLPDGQYKITANFNGVIKTRAVTIDKNNHSRVVLLWDNRTLGETSHEN